MCACWFTRGDGVNLSFSKSLWKRDVCVDDFFFLSSKGPPRKPKRLGFLYVGLAKRQRDSLFLSSSLTLKKNQNSVKSVERKTLRTRNALTLCRHGSARERTKGTSLSLSLSLSLSFSRTKKTKRAVFERRDLRAKSQSFPKFFFSLRTISSRVFSLPPRRRVQNYSCSSSPSSFKSHRARPRKDARVWESTVRALVLYLLASDDALVFSSACVGPNTARLWKRERKRLKPPDTTPPLCVFNFSPTMSKNSQNLSLPSFFSEDHWLTDPSFSLSPGPPIQQKRRYKPRP